LILTLSKCAAFSYHYDEGAPEGPVPLGDAMIKNFPALGLTSKATEQVLALVRPSDGQLKGEVGNYFFSSSFFLGI
jgi:hypothetical protein